MVFGKCKRAQWKRNGIEEFAEKSTDGRRFENFQRLFEICESSRDVGELKSALTTNSPRKIIKNQ
jgi:hypothetical protein